MNPKLIPSLLFSLLLAVFVRAEPGVSDAANWQLAQTTKSKTKVPSRQPVTRPRPVAPLNEAPPTPGAANTAPNAPTPSAAANAGGATNVVGQNVTAATHTVGGTNITAGVTNKEEATIIYNFPATPIEQILTEYATLVNRTLFRAGQGASAVPANLIITLKTQNPLTRSEAIMALETILGMNGVTIIPIGEKFAKVVIEASAPQAGGAPTTEDSKHLPDAGRFVTQIVQLKYALAQDIQAALVPFAKSQGSIIIIPSTQTVILRDYSENVKRMLEMVEKIDVVTPLEIKAEVIPIKYALAGEIASALGNLGGGGTISVGKGSAGGGLRGGAGSTGSTGQVPGNIGNYGNPGMNPGGMNPGGGGSPMSTGLGNKSSFQSNLQKIIHQAAGSGEFQILGQTKIIADERTNSLLVFANDQDMTMIKDIIKKLDVVLAQVLIEAIILEVSLKDSRDVGISYLQRPQGGTIKGAGGLKTTAVLPGASSTDTNTSSAASSLLPTNMKITDLPGGFSYFAKFNKDLDVVLTAIAGDGRINVLSRPRIQTSHNQEADLFVGDTIPYVTGTYFGGGFNGSSPSSQYTTREVGITLSVLPLINPDGLVVMQIQQNVEQLGAPVAIAGVGDVPSTTKRNATSTVAVRDRETIILGGFISNTKSTSHSGIPYLKDLPGLGVLFRSSSRKNERVELIVLLRPTVLPTPQDAALMATFERNKLSGVKQAELELREDERARWAAIEAQLKKDADQKKKKGTVSTNEEPVEPFPAVRPENPLIPNSPLHSPPATPAPTVAPATTPPATVPPAQP